MEQKQIHFSKTETRAELLKRMLPFRRNTKTYELDQLANERKASGDMTSSLSLSL
jgi:hypothetical protein